MHPSPNRRYDIDWLRIGAVYLLFIFHAAMVFNPAPFYHIRNHEVGVVFLIIAGFISLWHMPLFFLLAGWSAHASLSGRGTGGFLRERVMKIWVPLVMGCVLLMPPIKYLELRGGLDANYRGLFVRPDLQASFAPLIPSGLPDMAPFDQSFLEFLPTFFTHLERFTWAHLWFIAYLFVFTLIYLPLFRWLLARRGEPVAVPRWWVYAPVVPLALIQVTLRPYWPGLQNLYDDWANVAYYSVYLLTGFLLARYPGIEATAQREWPRALALGLTTTVVLLLGVLGVFQIPSLMLAGSAVAGWCFVVAILGLAHRFLATVRGRIAYLRDSAFPVYWLHQSAIVLIGAVIIELDLGIGAKFLLLVGAAVAATLAVYHFIVRRFTVTRFCVGMPNRSAPLAAPLRTALVLLAIGAAGATGARATEGGPLGRWYAEGGAAQVEIAPCGEAICGRVMWLRSPFDEHGCALLDRRNGDPALRARPVVGLEILRGLRPSADDPRTWEDGSIYDPSSGRTYSLRLTALDANRLELRGYLGVPLLGRTTTWIRVGAEARVCRAATGP